MISNSEWTNPRGPAGQEKPQRPPTELKRLQFYSQGPSLKRLKRTAEKPHFLWRSVLSFSTQTCFQPEQTDLDLARWHRCPRIHLLCLEPLPCGTRSCDAPLSRKPQKRRTAVRHSAALCTTSLYVQRKYKGKRSKTYFTHVITKHKA